MLSVRFAFYSLGELDHCLVGPAGGQANERVKPAPGLFRSLQRVQVILVGPESVLSGSSTLW